MPDETTPYETFDQPPLFCTKCGVEIPVKVFSKRSKRYIVRIGCQACAEAVKLPEQAAAKQPEQARFADLGSIWVE